MDLGLLKQLDYSIYTNHDRAKHARKLITPEIEKNIVNYMNKKPMAATNSISKQLEGLANYILYGKDPDTDTNIVQDKYAQIDGKFNSYKKKEPSSLEQLMENPLFNEQQILKEKNTYTKPKQTIERPRFKVECTLESTCTVKDKTPTFCTPWNCPNRHKTPSPASFTEYQVEHDGNIPGMVELWHNIDKMQYIFNVNKGRQEEDDNVPKLTPLALYKLQHWLIDVRRHQFYLKDSYKPQIFPNRVAHTTQGRIDWNSDSKYLIKKTQQATGGKGNIILWTYDTTDWHIVRKHTFDETNPDHIYQTLKLYSKLKQDSETDFNGDIKYILWTIEENIERANLTPSRKLILERKIDGWTNKRICDELREKFQISYGVNYLSTIWKKEICVQIANAAKNFYEQWKFKDQPQMWKKCSYCGVKKLRTTDNFTRKGTASDGLSARCKVCDKELREEKKEAERVREKELE